MDEHQLQGTDTQFKVFVFLAVPVDCCFVHHHICVVNSLLNIYLCPTWYLDILALGNFIHIVDAKLPHWVAGLQLFLYDTPPSYQSLGGGATVLSV